VDRSIVTDRFAHGRDVGVAFVGENPEKTYSYSVGMYNGNGINQARDENEDYLAAARLAITPMGAFELTESDPDWTRRPEPKLSIAVAVLTNQMGEGSFEEERVNSGALELAFRVRGFSIIGEFFTESRDVLLGLPGDETDTDGWQAQAGYMFPMTELSRMEIAARYAEILRDTADSDDTEYGVSWGWYFGGHGNKVQVDYRVLEYEGLQFGERVDTHQGRVQYQLIF
jgi:hypothetical protein